LRQLKSGICSIKSGGKQYKISEITGICRGCSLPVFTRKYPANACNFMPNYCFFVSSVHLPVGTGYGCSLLVASNVFVRTKPYLLPLNKDNAPHEYGNPKCKARALGWLSDERFPRDHRHQPAASLANRRARRDHVRHPPLMPNCTNSNASTLHRKGGCPVHQLARSWLQYRLTLASSTVLSKSKQRASQTFSSRLPRVSVS
jgi:hypothetical protein